MGECTLILPRLDKNIFANEVIDQFQKAWYLISRKEKTCLMQIRLASSVQYSVS
jgi:hypothetical protein